MKTVESHGSGNVLWMGIAATFALIALAAVAALGFVCSNVNRFNATFGCDVFAGRMPTNAVAAARVETKAAPAPEKTPEEEVKKEPPLRVERVEWNDFDRLMVFFNRRPDQASLRQYIEVQSLRSGALGFKNDRDWNREADEWQPTVYVTGDFALRTNLTLRIRKGLMPAGEVSKDALAEDYVFDFRRENVRPYADFVDKGRYLPPGGRQALRVEAIGIACVTTELVRVERRNVVQLLARDEAVYERIWRKHTVDDGSTRELAGDVQRDVHTCANVLGVAENFDFPVVMRDGGSPRGVFLATLRCADNMRHRLVCLSDLGLSVREDGNGYGVWVTSLTTGRPLELVNVAAYSSANILLAEATTDANGWCRLPRSDVGGGVFAVVARTRAGDDMTFMALADGNKVDETHPDGARDEYLRGAEVDLFAWTERGIYRHGEPILLHAVLRDRKLCAPRPMPIQFKLLNPNGNTVATRTVMTDALGSLTWDGFSAAAEMPSGEWTIEAALPGKDGRKFGEIAVRIEEFAPPQIRVAVSADAARHPSNFTFTVSAEHLFGGPARSLACEGAVVFEDAPFAPARWKGFTFGNEELGLKPAFRRLSRQALDEKGVCAFDAPLRASSGLPKAAVRMTGQGTVFEDGGRPATARKSVIAHYYPFYVGSNLPGWLKLPENGQARISLVCVAPDGEAVKGARKLVGRLERIDSVYAYKSDDSGERTWNCERVRSVVAENVEIPVDANGCAQYLLPARACGDYVFTATDRASGSSFGRTFHLSDWGDDVVRAPLSNPTEVVLQTDKAFYRVGERPRLVVKAPFTGCALLSVLREGAVYSEVLDLTNVTSEVVLRPIERGWAPNVDVAISVVQSVEASANRLAARAHGLATVHVRPAEHEIAVALDARVSVSDAGSRVDVAIDAPRARSAVVTLVDEGINLLTGEEPPDPVGWLGRARDADHPLYDFYDCILPVADGRLKAGGVKTGGGAGAEMLGRVSPVPTRRFKPLALWKRQVPIEDGKGRATFELPEFVGEVRVTAVAYSASAIGAASVQKKVSPRLVMQADAPRFVAPGDEFELTLPLRNCGDASGEVAYSITCGETGKGKGAVVASGACTLVRGGSTNVVVRVKAPGSAGEMTLDFLSTGFGERHAATIALPVRPAVAWRESAGVKRLEPGERFEFPASSAPERFQLTLNGTPLAELGGALAWLARYPHGCLEQTVSRVFPLIAAGGVLNAVASAAATNRASVVAAGVRRVESMVRANDFVMWPDCNDAPWDREVSLYAAHFLVEAERAGQRVDPAARAQVLKFLKRWSMQTNACVAAYACHTLALAGVPDKDRMYRLYDAREKLDALSRARLARAFVAVHDAPRAEELMKSALAPQSVREAAFRMLALLELDAHDAHVSALADYLAAARDKRRFSWGTTGENAHALLALGAYYRRHPAQAGEPTVKCAGTGEKPFAETLTNRQSRAFAAKTLACENAGKASAFLGWRRLALPDPADVADDSNGLFIRRRYLNAAGGEADLANLVRGEMLVVELSITGDVSRVVSDLVVEDLFAGAFEPVHSELSPDVFQAPKDANAVEDWVMRKDARDDRMLVFSKRFELKQGHEAKVYYPVRVVSAGDFTLPGPSVEGMYHPALHSRRAPGRVVVRR